MKQLEAGELSLGKIFASGEFDFEIPDYQRPYAWRTEQTLQLLDDLEDALVRDTDEPYFLGSIVLVKEKGNPRAEVIDGQQRLTTLTILLSVMRDLAAGKMRNELQQFIAEPGQIWAGTKPKPRLRLREKDADFFSAHVQTPDSVTNLIHLTENKLKTDSQRAISENAAALWKRISDWPEDKRRDLFVMMGQRTYLVLVSTPDLTSAHRIFSVMNARGLDLSPADIFKANVIGTISSDERAAYADKWEDAEESLGREGFSELFQHIRMIYSKVRARQELLREFPEQVLNQFLPNRSEAFVDNVLLPYATAYEHLLNQDYSGSIEWTEVNSWLRRLVQIDNSDWRPPALWALRHHGDDPVFLKNFLCKLERLAASMLIRRTYATPRASKYAELLRDSEAGFGVEAAALRLTEREKAQTLDLLNGELYLTPPVRKYTLLRLDELLANTPGVSYQYRIITVEHVLPQTPGVGSQWLRLFDEEQRLVWTHRLANLILLNRNKNSAAQNYDFEKKKMKYFSDKHGVAIFALTTQVLATPEWTPRLLQTRQENLVAILKTEWQLGPS